MQFDRLVCIDGQKKISSSESIRVQDTLLVATSCIDMEDAYANYQRS